MLNVFIDGSAGTTGLCIFDRLEKRSDVVLIKLPEEKRKDPHARQAAINSSDVTFLCLPDAAAIESSQLCSSDSTVIIDTSTAHRTAEGWTYGFPELDGNFYESISRSHRIAVPGCHASGFISLIYPLVKNGIIFADAQLCCHSLTGYSGGGKKMISDYSSSERSILLDAPREYGLTQTHKHLKEMQVITGLSSAPVFCPIVSDYYSGMVMTVALFASQLLPGKTTDDIKNVYSSLYTDKVVSYRENISEDGFISAGAMSGKDSMEISVLGNGDRILLVSRYDNLGKGASGAAVQCMNIVTGKDMTEGLVL